MTKKAKTVAEHVPVTPFTAAVLRTIRAIPKGKVLSYSEVALLAGRAGGARAVARVLRVTEEKLPWWRVCRANRTFAPEVRELQEKKLRAEGVSIVNGKVQSARLAGARSPAQSPGHVRSRSRVR